MNSTPKIDDVLKQNSTAIFSTRPIIACLFLTAMLWSACGNNVSANETITLWPGAVPGEAALSNDLKAKIAEAELKNTDDRKFGVTNPTMTTYPASEKTANGTGVIIFPGGGYNILAWDHEGRAIAHWFNSIGVHAFVVTYRVPRRVPDFKTPPLQDAQRAIRLVRANADEHGISPNKIGILGFSAGGNLVVNAGTQFHKQTYPRIDAADDLSCKPDFMIPIYAAYLGSEENDQILDQNLQITSDTPPTFLAVTQDDKNRGIHSAELFAELTRAGVKAEVHVYTKGGHGYGIRESDNPVSQWHNHCENWMRSMGWLPASK